MDKHIFLCVIPINVRNILLITGKVPSTKLFVQELQISLFNIGNVCGINSLLY